MSEAQKTAVIFGLANKRSIAWAIAQKLQQAGGNWQLLTKINAWSSKLKTSSPICQAPRDSCAMSRKTISLRNCSMS